MSSLFVNESGKEMWGRGGGGRQRASEREREKERERETNDSSVPISLLPNYSQAIYNLQLSYITIISSFSSVPKAMTEFLTRLTQALFITLETYHPHG